MGLHAYCFARYFIITILPNKKAELNIQPIRAMMTVSLEFKIPRTSYHHVKHKLVLIVAQNRLLVYNAVTKSHLRALNISNQLNFLYSM